MNSVPPLEQAHLEELLAEHQEVIHLANELEYCLYRLGETQGEERVTACQQAGGALIGRLRTLLFRHDQLVFPLLQEAAQDHDPEP
jgi:hypothetical protein